MVAGIKLSLHFTKELDELQRSKKVPVKRLGPDGLIFSGSGVAVGIDVGETVLIFRVFIEETSVKDWEGPEYFFKERRTAAIMIPAKTTMTIGSMILGQVFTLCRPASTMDLLVFNLVALLMKDVNIEDSTFS